MNFKFIVSSIMALAFMSFNSDKITYDTQMIIATMFFIAALYFMENKK